MQNCNKLYFLVFQDLFLFFHKKHEKRSYYNDTLFCNSLHKNIGTNIIVTEIFKHLMNETQYAF